MNQRLTGKPAQKAALPRNNPKPARPMIKINSTHHLVFLLAQSLADIIIIHGYAP
ncbi:hypothetical protein [Shewanella salipaludis]|uniref:Uncharacterized protein n=1 Tax=Shewanella salipaludis TaxID=2723052 RepID=A0A972FZG7_9GAMM|nr:hypothetical protein [Shewanella salipaludis]NMH66043.1 hypothetical protein [Shewanella salipaludis]